jgi:hypothetical protein
MKAVWIFFICIYSLNANCQDYTVSKVSLGSKKDCYIDSCVNCVYLGLTEQEWEIKDKPYWKVVDSLAYANNRCMFFAFPSQETLFCSMYSDSMTVYVYHPSIKKEILITHHYSPCKLKN